MPHRRLDGHRRHGRTGQVPVADRVKYIDTHGAKAGAMQLHDSPFQSPGALLQLFQRSAGPRRIVIEEADLVNRAAMGVEQSHQARKLFISLPLRPCNTIGENCSA